MASGFNTASTSSNFESIFSAALAEYTKKTGKDLRNDSIINKIGGHSSPDSIFNVLQEQSSSFEEFRSGNTKLLQSLKPIVNVVQSLSTVAGSGNGFVFPPSMAIFSAIEILLSAAKDGNASYDTLVEIFECIGNFLKRLEIYTKVPPTPAITDIVVKILIELLSVLALATKQINRGRFSKYTKGFWGEKESKEIESALQRLDRLTLEESRTTTAQTLDVVYGLVENMRVIIDDGKASVDGIRRTSVLMQELASEANKFKRDHFQENLRRWLSAPDPWVNHNSAQKARLMGTGTWFMQGDTMSNWKSLGSLLWIHGLPGSGKSVLCSTIVEDLQHMCHAGLAALALFCFDFRDAGKQDARGLLSSLLFQLCQQSSAFFDVMYAQYMTHANGCREPSEGVLMECLKDMLKIPGQAPLYIVVDALDECPSYYGYPSPRAEVLKIMQELIHFRNPHVHICITSRLEVDIIGALESLADHNLSLHDQTGQNRDISDYIRSVVYSDPEMMKWREGDKQFVIDTLTERSGGMFRWVYCQIEALCRCFSASIRRTLDELPETLDGTYEQTLRRIDKQKRDHAHRLFQCMVVSKRPLQVEELAELFAVQPAETITNFNANLRPEDPVNAVLSACSTLVTVVNFNGQNIVQFSHFSVREYLLSDRITISEHVSRFHVLPRLAHALLARVCLSVLLQLDDRVYKNEIQQLPLAFYAAQYWVDHAQFEDVSSEFQLGMECLFDKNKPHFAAWLRLYDIDSSQRGASALSESETEIEDIPTIFPAPPYAVPLYYAALCGFRDLAGHLVDAHPQDVDAQGGRHVTPLHAALKKGHLSVAMLLAEHVADTDSRDSRSQTPLHLASLHGYLEVLSLLIDRGADLDAEQFNRKTPLHLASEKGYNKIVRLLSDHGADVNRLDNGDRTALHFASEGGHDAIVQLLLDHGADADHPESCGWTALHLTVLHGHNNVIQLLLDHGADTNLPDKCGWTALHHASQEGLNDVVRLLLDHGADANHQENSGLIPLHLALLRGHNDIIQLLIDYGADTNHPDNRGWTPLHHASGKGLDDIVQLLLNHGAVANNPDNRGWTPLYLALLRGHNDIVRFLLRHGANADHRDNHGLTPMYLASLRGQKDTVQSLLDHGADLNYQDNRGLSPLHLASMQGYGDTAQLLIEHGADVNHLDNHGWSPLHHASLRFQDHDNIIQLLINFGAVASHPDNLGWASLHHASRESYDEVVQLLLYRGDFANYSDNHD